MRLVAMRVRSIAAMLSPCLVPNAVPVSTGAAKGSKPSLTQSRRMALKVAMMWAASKRSV